MSVLCTGGLGYIGSHTVVALAESGYGNIIIVDNCSNSNYNVYFKLKSLVPKECKLFIYLVDLCDMQSLVNVFETHTIDVVIHFAALKSVGDSCRQPINYYENNLIGTLNLLRIMKETNCKTMVYSSSATVYTPMNEPVHEDVSTNPSNPYGRTKLMVEQILHDVVEADSTWRIVSLRYFNPVGCHPSGVISDRPTGVPSNLFPYISQLLSGELKQLTVHGNDYDTPDGTCLRDYVHVQDIAMGHVAAINYIQSVDTVTGLCEFINLGSGKCYSVTEVISMFETITGKKISYNIGNRRKGDIAFMCADITKANHLLNWYPRMTLYDAVSSVINKK